MASQDIYQEIWSADLLEGAGVRAVLPNEEKNPNLGYVEVAESDAIDRAKDLLPGNPSIPTSKTESYTLAEALFDNYAISASIRDTFDANEAEEVDALLEYVVTTPPMVVARRYISERSGRAYTEAAWSEYLRNMWFRSFSVGSSPSRSGFEHVFLGETTSSRVGGLHWWYFYDKIEDQITYEGAKYGNVKGGDTFPEIATMTFSWKVNGQNFEKPIGGFFVGPSVEGLMALGTVRADPQANAPRIAFIEGAEIDMKLFKSPDGRSVNTFYPVLKRVLSRMTTPPGDEGGSDTSPAPAPTPSGNDEVPELLHVRIVGAMTNPTGADQGREAVTLMNIGPKITNAKGWAITGPRGGVVTFGDVRLLPWTPETFTLSARSSVALSNSGGEIKLRSSNGTLVQTVSYSGSVGQGQGVVWDGADDLVVLD